ncbi:MAG TPA: hypothetical protein VEJ38_01840 [Candidatus Acidoferrales bacterium]|nr:hypothetical protein [Candidatus Acidoferrales bacterium]
MKINALILSGAALIVLNVAPAFAQQTDTSSTTSNPPTINQRKDNQQDRIANGVQSGQLTAGETKRLETREAAVNKEESNMRSADDGHLTAADRATINRQQNRLSDRIYDDKHNARTAHYGNNEVGQRRENQQDRIAQGIRSGQLTAGETARLERQQQSINREDAAMRAANGGKLTAGDKAALNQRQNNASKNIYAKKHNGRTQK